MAITITAIPATDLAKRALDKPLVVGRNNLELAYQLAAANMVANTLGTVSADASAASPNGRDVLQTRLLHRMWKFGSSVTTTYIVIDTGAGTPIDVDSFIVAAGHNWDTATITVEADSTTPALPWTGATAVWAGFVQSGNGLIAKFQPTNMYAARYWRIKIAYAGATVAQAPSIWLGKAVQFLNKSDRPWKGPAVTVGATTWRETGGGVAYGYRKAGGLQERPQKFTVAGALKDGVAAVTDPEKFLSNYEDFWKNSNACYGGAKAFWYFETPTTNPGGGKLLRPVDPHYDVVQIGPQETSLILSTKEMGAG